MRSILLSAVMCSALCTPTLAQEGTAPNGEWGTIANLDSGDLAIRGWTLIGTTGIQAGPQTGLLVTFWRANNGTTARCVFSLVNPSGADQFETCSIAVAVAPAAPTADAETGDTE